MKWILILLVLVSLPLMAADTGYRIVHPDGTVEFTDDPTRGGEEIPLREAPTYKSPPVPSPSSEGASSASEQRQPRAYETVTILSPQSEQTIWFDGRGVSVSVQVTPPLAADHHVIIEMDGNEVASGRGSSFSISGVFRGSHSLKATVVDAQGKRLLSSDPVTFHMKRHSIKTP
jgi:hypothetical protein